MHLRSCITWEADVLSGSENELTPNPNLIWKQPLVSTSSVFRATHHQAFTDNLKGKCKNPTPRLDQFLYQILIKWLDECQEINIWQRKIMQNWESQSVPWRDTSLYMLALVNNVWSGRGYAETEAG